MKVSLLNTKTSNLPNQTTFTARTLEPGRLRALAEETAVEVKIFGAALKREIPQPIRTFFKKAAQILRLG